MSGSQNGRCGGCRRAALSAVMRWDADETVFEEGFLRADVAWSDEVSRSVVERAECSESV
jgi:hypothetical protein